MKRRHFLLGVTSVFSAGAGCMSWNSGSTPDSTETTEPTPTDEAEVDTAPSPTETTTTVQSNPESYLPEPPDEWEYRGTRDWINGWTPLGARDGVIGQYRGPNGHPYEVLIMDMGEPVDEINGRRLACAGWQVALAIDRYSIAASTGTPQDQTLTPERPPTMTQTAVPGTEDKVIELLTYSPDLSNTEIEENRRVCHQDSDERNPDV